MPALQEWWMSRMIWLCIFLTSGAEQPSREHGLAFGGDAVWSAMLRGRFLNIHARWWEVHNPGNRCAQNTHSTAMPVSNAVCLKNKAPVTSWWGTGAEQVDQNRVLGWSLNNDSTTSVLFQGKQGNMTIYSKSRPWPVTLKKMKWNSSSKTHKTFYNWYPKKMSFTLGNWDAK